MADDHAGWDPAFEKLLLPYLHESVASAPLSGDLDLRAAGLDSLGAVELLVGVEETYGVHFSDDDLTFDMFTTPATLWNAVAAVRGGSACAG
jgi:acyl carrier protein